MCWTIGASSRSRGSVTLTCSPSLRTGSREPADRRRSLGPGPGGVDHSPRADRPARGLHGEAAARRRPHRSRCTGCVRADRSAVPGGAQGVEGRREQRIRVALERAVGGADDVLGEVRREAAQLAPSSTWVSRPACSSISLLSCSSCSCSVGLCDHQAAGDVHLERAVEFRARGRATGVAASTFSADLGQQSIGDRRRPRAGQLVDRDLQVEAAGVGPRRLAVELAALDQHRLDAALREVVRHRRPDRPRRRRRARRYRRESDAVSSAALSQRGAARSASRRRGGGEESMVLDRVVGHRRDRDRPQRHARGRQRDLGDRAPVRDGRSSRRSWRWQLRPLAQPHAGAGVGLHHVDVGRTSTAASSARSGNDPRSGRPSFPGSRAR